VLKQYNSISATFGGYKLCGIAGFCSKKNNIVITDTIRSMSNKIEHRGPDDEGFWIDKNFGVALGHRRLSIIDLSPAGHQPMVSHSGRYVIAYNGEVYNYQDILNDMTGHTKKTISSLSFKGSSDTEIILEAIELFGLEGAVKSFAGMFAFALYDRKEKKIHLVRDRAGEKPLYYGFVNSAFVFASELKAIRTFPGFKDEIDRDVLSLYFRHNYIPAPYSIYKDIYKLTPASILTMDINTLGEPEITTYWSALDIAQGGVSNRFTGSEAEAVKQLEVLLRQSIRGQMISDVPLGAFLSGGIDSSLIVSLMQTECSRPVKTFTIGFNEKEFNEAVEAKKVAAHLGTEHTELYVSPEEARSVIPKLPELYDEPFSDSSQIPTFLVSKLAREHVAVSLSGDGGDELFGGYPRYFETQRRWSKIDWIPQGARRFAAKTAVSISPGSWDKFYHALSFALPSKYKNKLLGEKVHKLARVLASKNALSIYDDYIIHWQDSGALVMGSHKLSTILDMSVDSLAFDDQRSFMMYLDLVTYLPDCILAKVDRAAMGVSLETRVPYLDYRVMEFAWELPLPMKFKNGKGKWILREILYKYVPKEMIERPKMGFGVPIGDWMRGPLKDWTESLVNESRLKNEGYLNPDLVSRMWNEHLSGTINWQFNLWDVLMFEAWLEKNKSI
jgi:asparagine synthase (glutamine-hydrolysing)